MCSDRDFASCPSTKPGARKGAPATCGQEFVQVLQYSAHPVATLSVFSWRS